VRQAAESLNIGAPPKAQRSPPVVPAFATAALTPRTSTVRSVQRVAETPKKTKPTKIAGRGANAR
jgi:hypothetical protein